MGDYLKATFLLICLFKLSECESVLENIDSITIEIDIDSENNKETTKKSEFINKNTASDLYYDNEANTQDQKNTFTTKTDDSKMTRREGDSDNDFEKSTAVNEDGEKQNIMVTFSEAFSRKEEQNDVMDDDSVIKLRSKALRRFHKKQKIATQSFGNEPIHTSELPYETKFTQEDSYYTNEHGNKASFTSEYAPLDAKVHNLLHRYKTTPATTLDDLKFNENENKSSQSPHLNIKRIKAITPLTSITDYNQIPTKTTVFPRPLNESTDSIKDLTDLNKDSTEFPKESTFTTNSENMNTIIDNSNDPIKSELLPATGKNNYDETTLSDHIDKESVRKWMPLNVDSTPSKIENTILTDTDEPNETKTVVPITWLPEYETMRVANDTSDLPTSVAIKVTNNNYTLDLETTTESVQNVSTFVTENTITITNKTNKSMNKIVCKYSKKVGDFDINKLTGVLQTVYYTMPEKIPCFKMFVMKLSNEEKQQYHEVYGDFQGRINWTRCDLEIKAETKIQRKHFLQSTDLSDGVFENKIIVDEYADADVDEIPTLVEDSPDQWSVVNDLVLLRDCKTGRVLFFKKNPRNRVSHRELKEALFKAGEGFNGRLSCRHKGHDTNF